MQQRVVSAARGAGIGLFVRGLRGILGESVLQVVDADLDRLRISDRAEMARNFETALVCLADGSAQFVTRDVRVCLERRHAAIRPKGDSLPGILGAQELGHLETTAGPIEIRARDIEMRTGQKPRVDGALELEVRVRLRAARGPHGRDAIREIQVRRREGHLLK